MNEEGSQAVGTSLSELDTPALIVDLDILHRNIKRMADTIVGKAGVGWRPHTKAMRTPALAHMCLQEGAHGVTCATLSEAERMAAGGIADILIANQIVDHDKIDRLAQLCRKADIAVCVDNLESARRIDRAAATRGVKPRLLIEVDVGMARAGVAPGNDALTLAQRLVDLQNTRFVGLQTWEAHTLRITDQEEKRRRVLAALRNVTDTAQQIRDAKIPVDIVSCGGTGTYWLSAFAPGVTEIEAGGGIFCDRRYRHEFGVDHEYALTVLATVTSRPTPHRVICNAGFKVLGSGHGEPEPLDIGAVEAVRLSAEHGTITLASASDTPRVGDRIQWVPGYSDATVMLHDDLFGMRAGRVETHWPLFGRNRLR